MQGKLAHHDDVSADVLYRTVHHAVLVVEDTHADDLAAEPFDVLGGVGVLDAQKDKQTGADRGGEHSVGRYTGTGDALDDSSHVPVFGI